MSNLGIGFQFKDRLCLKASHSEFNPEIFTSPLRWSTQRTSRVRCPIFLPRFKVLSKGIDETTSALVIDQVSLTFEAFTSGQRLSSKLQKNSVDSSSQKRKSFGFTHSKRRKNYMRYTRFQNRAPT